MEMSLIEISLKCSTLEKLLEDTNVWDLGIIFAPNEIFDKHITSNVAKGIGWQDGFYEGSEITLRKLWSHY